MQYSSLSIEDIRKVLLDSGMVDEKKLVELEKQASEGNYSLCEAAVNSGAISEDELAKLVADVMNVPFVTLSRQLPGREILALIPEVVARKKRIIPFKKDQKGLHLAMADPGDIEIINFIERKEGITVKPYMAAVMDIESVLEMYGEGLAGQLEEIFGLLSADQSQSKKKGHEAVELPIIDVVNRIILHGYHNRASDIHIEPRENRDSAVRFRIDGVLHDVAEIPALLHGQVVSRVKVLSRLRTDEHQVPQDGKIEFPLEETGTEMDIRVSIVPITEGEKAVLRLLSDRSRQFSLTNLGFSRKDLDIVQQAYKKPYGMILATGPTGCGKTTTLYAILKLLNSRRVNIMTIEDPVEYDIEGVNQIQVNPKSQLTFATGLRSILRQDPNIILVGEIRDKETAGIAVNLALTGHLVLSTLHTNDSATAIPRLVDLGIEPFLIGSTVSVVVAQRLVRRLHDACRVSQEVTAQEIAKKIGWELAAKVFGVKQSQPEAIIRLYRGKGCDGCQSTGYKGRVGIFEVMSIDDNLRQAIPQNQEANFLSEIAQKNGMQSMLEDGLEKVCMGITTIDEVLGATKI